jgi:hypothetical protein
MEFSHNAMFCIKCNLHDTFWSGGNSWGIDHCPICGCQETILWENMSNAQKEKAKKLFAEWWKKERIKKNG